MNRVVPALVSFLGSLGLACALAYLLLIVRAFGPGNDAVIDFLIGESDEQLSLGFVTVLVPYALLLAHLYLRVRVGDWLLRRGAVDAARSYASRRIKPTLLRAKKEAIVHRSVVARVHVREQEYDAARDLLAAAERLPRRGPFLARFRRWELEIELRREDLVAAHAVIDAAPTFRNRSDDVAAFHACVAEVAVRENDREAAHAALDRADWASAGHPRTGISRAFAVARFGDPEISAALQALNSCEEWLADVPGASAEVLATRARLLSAGGDDDAAGAALDGARDATADRRSRWVVERTGEELEDEDGT